MSVKIKISHIAFLVRIAFGLNSSYFSFLGHREILKLLGNVLAYKG